MNEADEEAALWGADHFLLYVLKVIRMTGFMKGLYTDAEMKSDNVKVVDFSMGLIYLFI